MKELIEKELYRIEIPTELHEICEIGVKKAKEEMEEKRMSKRINNRNKDFVKYAIAAALVICICIITVNSTAIADSVKGFFNDVIGFGGAVVGTEYLQATDEIQIDILEPELENETILLPIEVTLQNKDAIPFKYIEQVTLGKYKILDESGKVILSEKNKKENAPTGTIIDGKIQMDLQIMMEKISGENNRYILKIDSLYGSSKADAPLEIKGNWECEFEINK